MNKKVLSIGVLALLLVISVGFVSAQSENINVQAAGDMPDQITVSLLCDGNVVGTATLNNDNSWKTTFDVGDDGNYKLVAKKDSGYSFSVSGNAKDGFVISSTKIVTEDVLGVAGDIQLADDGDGVAGDIQPADGGDGVAGDIQPAEDDDNSTEDNSTEENATDDNTTDEDVSQEVTSAGSPAGEKTVDSKVVKKDKPIVKKENKTVKAKLRNTGIPLVVLVIAVFAAIFIPFNRKNNR